MISLWILLAGVMMAQTTVPQASVEKTAGPPASASQGVVPPPSAGKVESPPAKPPPAKPAETLQSAMEKQRAAIAIQRLAVKKQHDSLVPWMLGTPRSEAASESDGAAEDCDPIGDPELTPLITSAAQQHGVEPKLLRGVIEQESAFRACAISAKGAMGLMQLMPATVDQFKVDNVFDPKQNIDAGATYLRQLLDKYQDDIKLALAAYNAGPTTVDKMAGIPDIKETRDYVEGVIRKMQ
jgi:soluble lytic murein transglycosylase-like protein